VLRGGIGGSWTGQTQYDLGGREASGQLPRRGTSFEFVVRFNPRERVGPPKVSCPFRRGERERRFPAPLNLGLRSRLALGLYIAVAYSAALDTRVYARPAGTAGTAAGVIGGESSLRFEASKDLGRQRRGNVAMRWF
jgi:hypothetical protein